MYSNLRFGKCCVSNRERIKFVQVASGVVGGVKLVSFLMFMHYILEYSISWSLAGSWSRGSGSLPCRSRLIMANFKKKFSP